MKKFLFFVLTLIFASSAGLALAADVEMKAFFFDNDSGGKLTTLTKNVGVRIIVTNNTSSPIGFDSLQLSSGVQLYPMSISSYNGVGPAIRWYAPLTNQPMVGVGINTGSVAVQGGVFSVEKAVFEGGLTQWKAGYYFPSVAITAFNHQLNQYQYFSAGKEPIEVLEVKGKVQQNPLTLNQVIADFHSTRLGYAAVCSASANNTINCDVTLTTQLYALSTANSILTNQIKKDLTELISSVKAKNVKAYDKLSCSLNGVSSVINFDAKNKYMLQNVQCKM